MKHDLTHRRYVAARHILTGPSIASRTAPYVAGGRIDWHGILAETATMSGGERFLVGIARALWTGEAVPGPYELEGELDVGNAERVAEAKAYLGESQQPGLAAAA